MLNVQSKAPLVLNRLTKSYGNTKVVENINLELNSGEIFGFLGPNGAGKSTTIKTIMNFLSPTSGSIKVFDQDSVKYSQQIKQNVGYLAGDFIAYENLTGRQLLTYLSSFNRSFDWQIVTDLVNLFNLELDKKISSLSKGNKQKLGIIQAFMHQPKLLILDEPTSGLDPLMQDIFFNLIKQTRTKGVTVFFSSHNIFEVQRIADRAGFIRKGKLIAIEDINNLRKIGLHKLEVHFSKPISEKELQNINNVEEVFVDRQIAKFNVKGSVNSLIKRLSNFNVISINQQETNLEDIFLKYYESDD